MSQVQRRPLIQHQRNLDNRGNSMQRMLLLFVLTCCVAAGTSSLSAASLSLATNSLVWNPAVSNISPSILIGLLNSQAVNDPDLLAGWQLNLKLQPQASATGTVLFNSAELPTSGYLLEGNSAGLISDIDMAGTTLTAFDDDDTLPPGVAVPASGKSLLSLNFSTPNNAQGTFQLIALAPPGGFTQWGDTTLADRFFANVPSGSTAPIVLATVTIVPEPSAFAIGGCGALLLASRMWRNRKNRRTVAAVA
jgi:hypothetical protein